MQLNSLIDGRLIDGTGDGKIVETGRWYRQTDRQTVETDDVWRVDTGGWMHGYMNGWVAWWK